MVKNILKILCLLMFAVAPGIVFADAAVSEASSVPVAAEQSKRVALAPITIPLKNSPKPTSFGRPILFYANNQPFNQPFILEHGQIFTTIEDAASALRLKMERQGDTICISGNGFSKNTCPANNSNAGLIYINGKSFPESAVLNAGETWVDVSALAHSLGYRYIFNRQTQIADLYRPVQILPGTFERSKNDKPAELKNQITQEPIEDEKMPFKIDVLDSFQRNWTCCAMFANNDIKYGLNVSNMSEKEIKNSKATFDFLDQTGALNAADPHESLYAGVLDSGESVQGSKITYNYSMVAVVPHNKVEWFDKNEKSHTWEDKERLTANQVDSLLLKRPEYAHYVHSFPQLTYPTAGSVSLSPAMTFYQPPDISEKDRQGQGNITTTPANFTNTGIPIATSASRSCSDYACYGEAADLKLPYSPANATLPASPAPSIPFESK